MYTTQSIHKFAVSLLVGSALVALIIPALHVRADEDTAQSLQSAIAQLRKDYNLKQGGGSSLENALDAAEAALNTTDCDTAKALLKHAAEEAAKTVPKYRTEAQDEVQKLVARAAHYIETRCGSPVSGGNPPPPPPTDRPKMTIAENIIILKDVSRAIQGDPKNKDFTSIRSAFADLPAGKLAGQEKGAIGKAVGQITNLLGQAQALAAQADKEQDASKRDALLQKERELLLAIEEQEHAIHSAVQTVKDNLGHAGTGDDAKDAYQKYSDFDERVSNEISAPILKKLNSEIVP